MRTMCGVKLVDRNKIKKMMEMLSVKKTSDKMAKANGVRWYEHVVRRGDNNILMREMMFEVDRQRK